MKRKIGLIGLGNIGSFYTGRLLECGYPLTVLDIDKAKLQAMADKGAKTAATPAELTAASDVIMLSLPGSEAVEEVMTEANGILSALREGQLVINTSTCRPGTAVKCQKLCAEKGAGFVDSPLSWRAKGQTLMVGCDEKDFNDAEEILKCISYRYKLVGPAGSGQYLKMINQAILADRLAVYCEAVELTKKCGLDPKLLDEHLEFDIPKELYTEDYKGGGHLNLHYKDLGYLNEIAHDVNANIPISALVHEMFKATSIYGEPHWIQPGIQTYYKRLNGGE
ncbi:MAG: NAD(P)-dependent oxidoreductase [Oscillospiraceae bacterium]|nr:NAD(P)-dependent oxidoreductase [Oscillospiraceae bacterium]